MFTKEVPEVGKITTIENGKAHFNADKTYHHVRVFLGKEKVHLLLTDKDIEKALYRVKKNFDDIETQLCYMLANASMTKQFTTDVSNQKQLEEENKSLQERIKLLEKENKSLQEENKSLQEQSTTKEEVEELQHKLFITRGQKVSLQDECQLYRDLILKIHHSEMMTYEEEKMLDDVLKPTVSSVLNDNY